MPGDDVPSKFGGTSMYDGCSTSTISRLTELGISLATDDSVIHALSSDRFCPGGKTFLARLVDGFLELVLCPHPVTVVFGTFEPPDRLDAVYRLCLCAWSTDTMPTELLERLVVHISAGNFRRVG